MNALKTVLKHRPIGMRVYDNGGKTADRYTVVFTGRYRRYVSGTQQYLGMSENPYHPQGIGMHGESRQDIDRPSYKHLGKKIDFDRLPPDCQRCALDDALELGFFRI